MNECNLLVNFHNVCWVNISSIPIGPSTITKGTNPRCRVLYFDHFWSESNNRTSNQAFVFWRIEYNHITDLQLLFYNVLHGHLLLVQTINFAVNPVLTIEYCINCLQSLAGVDKSCKRYKDTKCKYTESISKGFHCVSFVAMCLLYCYLDHLSTVFWLYFCNFLKVMCAWPTAKGAVFELQCL